MLCCFFCVPEGPPIFIFEYRKSFLILPYPICWRIWFTITGGEPLLCSLIFWGKAASPVLASGIDNADDLGAGGSGRNFENRAKMFPYLCPG